jgi:hypothetical protein
MHNVRALICLNKCGQTFRIQKKKLNNLQFLFRNLEYGRSRKKFSLCGAWNTDVPLAFDNERRGLSST